MWCHGPAGVNDSLRWRPGPTLCGNRRSRSECTGGREGGRRRAGGLSGEPGEHHASRRLTRTLLTLLLQQHLPDVDRAKADALDLKKEKKKQVI